MILSLNISAIQYRRPEFVGNILDENSTKEDMEYATNTSEKTGIDYYKVNRTVKNTLN